MRIIFMGRKVYSAELLQWTVKQGVDIKAVVTDSHSSNSLTAKKAKELGIPIISMEDAELILSHANHGIDLIVSYLFWRKIKGKLISEPKYGCINFHPAILPFWRGTGGYNIAILKKLSEWGATAHYIDDDIDTGNIIRIYKFNFDYRLETAQSLEKKTQAIQMELYKSVILDFYEKGKLDSTPQSKKEGVYISRAKMEDMKKIDIENDDIDLKIRAFWFPPYNGAFLELQGTKYTLINDYILKQLANDDTIANI